MLWSHWGWAAATTLQGGPGNGLWREAAGGSPAVGGQALREQPYHPGGPGAGRCLMKEASGLSL